MGYCLANSCRRCGGAIAVKSKEEKALKDAKGVDVVNVGTREICNGALNLWEAQRCHIIPAVLVKQRLGMTQPKSAPA